MNESPATAMVEESERREFDKEEERYEWIGSAYMTSQLTLGSSIADMIHAQASVLTPDLVTNAEEEGEIRPDTDGGYAWIVLLSCSMLQLICIIPAALSGLFYLEFLNSFERGEVVTSWIPSLQQAFAYFSCPLAAVLEDRIGARMTAIIGCVGAGVSLAIASIANNFVALFVLYGILAGTSLSLVYIPACTFPVQYFRKYRTTALCIGTAAAPLIFVCGPPVITWLMENYGWRNANLAAAAACIQGGVFASLLRPPRVSAGKDDLLEKAECSSRSGSELTKDMRTDGRYSTAAIRSRDLPSLSSIFHWRFWILIASNLLWGSSASVYLVLVPRYAELNGVPSYQIASLFVVYGCVSLGFRLLSVVINHFLKVRPSTVVTLGHFLMSAGLIGLIFSHQYMHFIVVMAVLGAAYSFNSCYANPTVIEMHGENGVSLMFGLEMLVYGLGATTAPPLAAYLLTRYGSYTPGFLFAAASALLGAASYVPHLIKARFHSQSKSFC